MKEDRQLRRPYFMNHQTDMRTASMAIDISKAFATSFAHSQYDIRAISGRLHCRAASIPGNPGKRQCSLCQSELANQLRRPYPNSKKAAPRVYAVEPLGSPLHPPIADYRPFVPPRLSGNRQNNREKVATFCPISN
jgi:hypothetical protein